MIMKKKISINLEHGNIDGIYMEAQIESPPLVIITNGHNGFYNYGMFPYLQEKLFEKGISSYSYNFSFGGVQGDSDYFKELDKYEKNCMRLEVLDLCGIVNNLSNSGIKYTPLTKLYLLAHSLGGIPTMFATEKLQDRINIDGLILISTIKTLDVWPLAMIEEWKKNKIYYLKNSRTKQDLPQGYEFLTEILKSETDWNVESVIKKIKSKFLIVHGEKDEAVPVEHSQTLFEWVNKTGLKSELYIIPNATHTYNTKHPFEESSDELNNMIEIVTRWINKG